MCLMDKLLPVLILRTVFLEWVFFKLQQWHNILINAVARNDVDHINVLFFEVIQEGEKKEEFIVFFHYLIIAVPENIPKLRCARLR